MLEILRSKPTQPGRFNYFMDHAWFSATILLRRLFIENGLELRRAHIDALTAILMHNSLYKFSIAHYKTESVNKPFRAALHPLAWMLMLCDELQCWDRTAYGRDSRRELHPFACRFTLRAGTLRAVYLFDKKQKGKMDNFEKEYGLWEQGKKEEKPKLKAWSEMLRHGDAPSDFQRDIERIVDLGGVRFQPKAACAADGRAPGCLSDSSFLNLYNFTLMVKARGQYEDWKTKDPEALFRELPALLDETEKSFLADSLEFRLDSIDRTKSYARNLERLGCFYSDRLMDFPEVTRFSRKEIDLLGALEHTRWLQRRYDMGWRYGKEGVDYVGKTERENKRLHQDLMKDWDGDCGRSVPEEAGVTHYRGLPKKEKDKDTGAMRFILLMMRYWDGVRFYRMREEK